MSQPTNLRQVSGPNDIDGLYVMFDGPASNDYQLSVRSKSVHGHQPLVDDLFGQQEYVLDPDGYILPQLNYQRGRTIQHPPRRTWTAVGGMQPGSNSKFAQAGELLELWASMFPDPGPWQIIIHGGASGDEYSNVLEWGEALDLQPGLDRTASREDQLKAAILHYRGRRIAHDGKPLATELSKVVGFTVSPHERNRIWQALGSPTGPQSSHGQVSPAVPSGKYASLIAQMYPWRNDPNGVHNKSHTDRWDRALLALGETVADTSLTPMTGEEAQELADRGWQRWVKVAEALLEIEADPIVTEETREQKIDEATRNFSGRRTRDGRPYVRVLRKQANLPGITTQERDASWRRVKAQ